MVIVIVLVTDDVFTTDPLLLYVPTVSLTDNVLLFGHNARRLFLSAVVSVNVYGLVAFTTLSLVIRLAFPPASILNCSFDPAGFVNDTEGFWTSVKFFPPVAVAYLLIAGSSNVADPVQLTATV